MDVPKWMYVLPLQLFKTLHIVVVSQVGQLRCTEEEQLFTECLDDHIREACVRDKRGVKKISIEWYCGEFVSLSATPKLLQTYLTACRKDASLSFWSIYLFKGEKIFQFDVRGKWLSRINACVICV